MYHQDSFPVSAGHSHCVYPDSGAVMHTKNTTVQCTNHNIWLQTGSALQFEVLLPSLVKCTNTRHNKDSRNMHSVVPQKSEMYLLRTNNFFLNMHLSKTFCKILRNMATILHSWKAAVSWQGTHKPHYCSTSVLGKEEENRLLWHNLNWAS